MTTHPYIVNFHMIQTRSVVSVTTDTIFILSKHPYKTGIGHNK